jgi:hypothetical protein
MSNRRQFVATTLGASALLSGLASTQAWAAQPAPPGAGSVPGLAMFQTLQGQSLEIRGPRRVRAMLQLVTVRDRACCQRLEQFTLVLRGDRDMPLASGIYRLAHQASGRFQLQLEPSGGDDRGAFYRADITRFT